MNPRQVAVSNPLTEAVVKAKTANNRHLERLNMPKIYSFLPKTTVYGRVRGVNHHLQTLNHRISIKTQKKPTVYLR
jgi:hypothetical protein